MVTSATSCTGDSRKINEGQRHRLHVVWKVVCPYCQEAARKAIIPTGWGEVNEYKGTDYWEWVAYCHNNNMKCDPAAAPPGVTVLSWSTKQSSSRWEVDAGARKHGITLGSALNGAETMG
jgi:hypothetical protein